MRIGPPGLIGMAFAAIGGSAYVVTGHRDFTVEVHRPLPEVYAAFSDVRNFGSGARDLGIDVPKVTVNRPSDHKLVFTMPSANKDQISRIAFTFASQPGSVVTQVSAAIDVPPVAMSIDGEDKYLSEAKVESQFRDSIAEIGKQLDQGNAPTAAKHKLALLLDVVALFSNPEKARQLFARMERERADIGRVKQSLERDGYQVSYKGPAEIEYRRSPDSMSVVTDPAAPTTDLGDSSDE